MAFQGRLLRAGTGLRPVDLGVSVGMHVFLLVLLVSTKACVHEPKPLFDPDEVMEVKMVALPKASGRNPDRATRAPDPVQGAPDAMETPAPPDAMKLQDPQAEKSKGDKVPDQTANRDKLLDSLKREALVRSMNANAPIGDVNRNASDPDSMISEEDIYGEGGPGIPVDPEIARWVSQVKRAVTANWVTLPSYRADTPNLVTRVKITLDEQGRVVEARVHKSSGNTAYDDSCVRAIQKTASLPLPPKKLGYSLPVRFPIDFGASDAK